MEVTTPENLYKAKYELENLTSEELIEAHNELIDFLHKLQDDVYNQIELINRVRIEKLGLEDEMVVTRIPRNRGE
tara:strand:+ start:17 stop:241 length:225 start_codon:yes stop_codon:yes gene_type:complete